MAATPKVDTSTRSADASLFVAVAGSVADGAAVVGKPPFCPQVTVLINTLATVSAALVMTAEDTTSLPLLMPPSGTIRLEIPVKTLTLPAGVEALMYWWERGTVPRNEFTVAARN